MLNNSPAPVTSPPDVDIPAAQPEPKHVQSGFNGAKDGNAYIEQLLNNFGNMNQSNVRQFDSEVEDVLKMGEEKFQACKHDGKEEDPVLMQAATTGKFDTRDKVGQKFRRHLEKMKSTSSSTRARTCPRRRK